MKKNDSFSSFDSVSLITLSFPSGSGDSLYNKRVTNTVWQQRAEPSLE